MSEKNTVTITIDGIQYEVPANIPLTKAMRRYLGIDIPTFCAHPRLDPVGACRQCLVEIETPRGPRLTTACTTYTTDGLVVFYNTEKARAAREATLEFLLANHPLDCPICDKGGECPLQDQTLRHGPGESRFLEEKIHKNKRYPISDLIMLDQERCVLCWRCIRYLEEWEYKPQLGLYHRGGESVIDIHPDHPLTAKTSGNIIDICPVGALTNRVARFHFRPWTWGPYPRTLQMVPSVCIHCPQGCNLRIDVRTDKVRRIVARENMAVNDWWICDKGRFAQGFFHHEERLTQPLVRRDGELRPATWDEALQRVVEGLYGWAQQEPEAVGAIGSGKVSNEANYLLQKFFRVMVDTNNIDHRWGGDVLADPRGMAAIEDIHRADVIVLLGLDVAEELPVFATFFRRAVRRNGAKAVIIHPRRVEDARFGLYLPVLPGAEAVWLNVLMARLVQEERFAAQARRVAGGQEFLAWLQEHGDIAALPGVDEAQMAQVVRLLTEAKAPLVLYGADVVRGRAAEANAAALHNLRLLLGEDRVAYVGPDANSLGARDMGVHPEYLPGYVPVTDAEGRERFHRLWGSEVPEEPGLTYTQMLQAAAEGRLKALFVMGADPAADGAWAARALENLDFLVVQDIFLTETARRADVVLPATTYAETDGTFTNMERRLQRAPQAFRPVGEARPDWAILVDLARRWPVREAGTTRRKGKKAPRSPQKAWTYTRPQDVLAEIAHVVPQYAGLSWEDLGDQGRYTAREGLPGRQAFALVPPPVVPADPAYPFHLVVDRFLYDHGTLIRTTDRFANLLVEPAARLHPDDVARLGLKPGKKARLTSPHGEVILPVVADPTVQPGTVALAYSLPDAPAETLMGPAGPGVLVNVQPAP